MSAESSMLAYIFLDCFHSCCSKYLDKKYLLFQRLGEALLGICNILLRDQGQEGRFIHWLSNLAHSFILVRIPQPTTRFVVASFCCWIDHSLYCSVVLFCFGFASGALLSLSTSASSVRWCDGDCLNPIMGAGHVFPIHFNFTTQKAKSSN